MPDKFTCTVVDWNYAYVLCKDVSEEMKAAGFVPEVVVGVARGGWFLARVICDFFLLKELCSLKMEHWGITAAITGEARLKYGLDDHARNQIPGKRVLIADDITDTGDSLKLVVEYVKSLGAAEVRTATMHHKTASPFVPDFYGELMREWSWVVYPWSIHEDLIELIERLLCESGKGLSLLELRTALKDEFEFYVPFQLLREVVANMAYHGKITTGKREGKEELWVLY
jgi:hypoxanthine phosphoribosyltransferase